MSQNFPVVVITGCSEGGIGFSLCEEFASKGCKVYATARRVEAMEGFKHEGIEHLRLDVTDDANVEEAVKTIIEREGRIDVLINNAGAGGIGPLAEMPIDRVIGLFDVNVFSIFRMSKAVFPHMASRKSGTIVNVGSIAGDFPTPWGGLYSATKSSVRSISESLYMECAPFGISVVHLSPGGVKSNISNTSGSKFSLSPDSFYTPWLDSIIRRIGMSQTGGAMRTEEFARRVVKAVLTPKPPRYMSMGKLSNIFRAFAWLPRGFVLWFMWSRLGGKRAVKAA